MDEAHFYRILLIGWAALAVLVFLLRLKSTFPQGSQPGQGSSLPASQAWLLMQLPAILTFVACYFLGPRRGELVPLVFLLLWLGHFLHRALIYPRSPGIALNNVASGTVLLVMFSNLVHGYLNGRILFSLGPDYPNAWLRSTPFIAGLTLFLLGWATRTWAESRLLRLHQHRPDEARPTTLPMGGLFERISCPDALGGILQWLGWALITWTLAGFTLALWTLAIQVPGALARHRGYRQRFADYPRRRKAFLPYLL